MLKFPIREMKKRSEREMGRTQIGEEVKLGMSLLLFSFISFSFGQARHTFPLVWKERPCPECFFFPPTCAALLLGH